MLFPDPGVAIDANSSESGSKTLEDLAGCGFRPSQFKLPDPDRSLPNENVRMFQVRGYGTGTLHSFLKN